VQSTGEKVEVALVLNKPQWLAEINYTLAPSNDRSNSWIKLIPLVERALEDDD
jgi:hypothetical protein